MKIDNTHESVLRTAYIYLKNRFAYLPKTNWIWVDFFSDQEEGYAYFKDTIEDDSDFMFFRIADFKDATENDLKYWAAVIASEVRVKLNRSLFFSEAYQATR